MFLYKWKKKLDIRFFHPGRFLYFYKILFYATCINLSIHEWLNYSLFRWIEIWKISISVKLKKNPSIIYAIIRVRLSPISCSLYFCVWPISWLNTTFPNKSLCKINFSQLNLFSTVLMDNKWIARLTAYEVVIFTEILIHRFIRVNPNCPWNKYKFFGSFFNDIIKCSCKRFYSSTLTEFQFVK